MWLSVWPSNCSISVHKWVFWFKGRSQSDNIRTEKDKTWEKSQQFGSGLRNKTCFDTSEWNTVPEMGSLPLTAPFWHFQSSMLCLCGSYPRPLLHLRAPVGKYKAPSSSMAQFCYQSYPAPTFQPLSHPSPEQQSWGGSQSTFQRGTARVKGRNRGLETSQIVALNKCEFSCQVINITDVFMK